MTAGPLVAVEGLSQVFDISRPWLARALDGSPRLILRAVQDVSFTIERGETFAQAAE